MTEIIKALIQAGGAIGALGFIWLIVRALVPVLARKHEDEANGLKTQVNLLQKELDNLRPKVHWHGNCVHQLGLRLHTIDKLHLPKEPD